MTLEQAYFTTEILVGIGFIVSIAFLAIQMRQNSYLLRQSMADQRRNRVSWLHETIVTDNDFRTFQLRIENEYDTFNENERSRANSLGHLVLRGLLNELVAYFDGQISEDEWINLQWNLEHACRRPNVKAAYPWMKDGYSKQVQEYWESLDSSGEGRLVGDLANPN
tara:strand:- start:575 stop:1072 length:498 start_codon:yes stop_codon:yes gene_type:complete